MEALHLFLDNFADWDSLVLIWPLLWQGLQLTVLLAVVTLPIAVAVGLLIAVAVWWPCPGTRARNARRACACRGV